MNEQHIDHLPIVEAFLAYLIDERHFSPYTSRCYGVDLRQYIDHLSEELNITSAARTSTMCCSAAVMP
jgi:site-specific recombinase XerD